MSHQTDPRPEAEQPTPGQQPTSAPDQQPGTPEPVVEAPAEDDTRAGREAAKYRRRAQDAEAARDALAERLTAMQRAEVERLAGVDLSVGADLFAVGGQQLDALLDEDGHVDAERVRAAVQELVTSRPGLGRRPGPRQDPSQGARGGSPAGSGTGWHDLLGRR